MVKATDDLVGRSVSEQVDVLARSITLELISDFKELAVVGDSD